MKLPLLTVLCISALAPVLRADVLYTFNLSWVDGPPVGIKQLGFTYDSPDFFDGGSLDRTQLTNCPGMWDLTSL